MSEDEVFSAAYAFRDYYRHKAAIDSGAMYQVAMPKKTPKRKQPARTVQQSVHSIPLEEASSSLVIATNIPVAPARKDEIVEVIKSVTIFWGIVHLLYIFVTWYIGKY